MTTYTDDFEGAIGIDLGTTYSGVAYMSQDGKVEVIANEQGNRTTPSYVAFTDTEKHVGDAAKNQAAMNPKNTVFDAKRLIGRRFDEPSVKKDMSLWPFEVINKGNAPFIQVEYNGEKKIFSPQEISSMVLMKMRDIAQLKIAKNVRKAVVTVPAYFNDSQRQATKDAGLLAGLEVLRIINEPTAAAIAYGLDKKNKDGESENAKDHNVLIFDLGGGTFDVSLLSIQNGVFTVKATAGDTHLGGEDFDNSLVAYMAEDFKKKYKHDITSDKRALRRLRTACERAKRTLSTLTKATVEIDSLYQGIDYQGTITRAKFEEINSQAFASTLVPVENVLKDSKLVYQDVHEVVLVGGSTRIPKIQSLLSDMFHGKELNRTINPDEAVAYGAAVQAALLTGTATEATGNLLLLDVVSLSLGVEMEGGVMAVVVPRNTPIPTIKKRVFTTTHDGQTTVEFPIYEGERMMTKDNNLLGEFTLSGLPPAPRGEPELETIFEVDANGLLKVTAIEKATNLTAHVTIANNPGRLNTDQINQMINDAELHMQEDHDAAARIDAKHELEEYLYQVENTLNDVNVATKLKNSDLIVDELSTIMDWLDVSGKEATKDELLARKRKLERTVNKVFASIYSQDQRRTGRGRRK
ncbi:hypothetical protein HMI55_006246 [Coelomomyces lativittatus]|nr:hypothetical protein HMI55_006246 [Coelomomyces lativittatus]